MIKKHPLNLAILLPQRKLFRKLRFPDNNAFFVAQIISYLFGALLFIIGLSQSEIAFVMFNGLMFSED